MSNSKSCHYRISHTTRFRYSAPVSESVMELRMQPRSEGAQRCLSFELSLHPKARVASHRDYLGNTVHHFDVPGRHSQLVVKTSAIVEIMAQPAVADVPPTRGIFKGEAESELSVAVQVTPFEGPLPELPAPAFEPLTIIDEVEQMQQQQQQ